MAKERKTKRQLADEAWLRAQQIDLAGQLESTGEKEEIGNPVDGIPEECPNCKRAMTVKSGWTILSEAGTPWQHGHLCCGFCGHEVLVTIAARDALRQAMHIEFKRRAAALAPLPKNTRGPRSRGAG